MKDSKECETCLKEKHVKSFRLTSSKSCKLCEDIKERPKTKKRNCLKCSKPFDAYRFNFVCGGCKQTEAYINDVTVYNFVR